MHRFENIVYANALLQMTHRFEYIVYANALLQMIRLIILNL